MTLTRYRAPLCGWLAFCWLGLVAGAPAESFVERMRRSVVKIHASGTRYDPTMPWQTRRPARGSGSGFILPGKRLLTNAHVVSDARFIEVQKDGDSSRYRAWVEFAGHDCDLATLRVDDPKFFDGTVPVRMANLLPALNDEVLVCGYPTGGDRMSITRGIVSRIEYSGYSHSGVDQHLAIQVDAAINPGNSGGPVLFNNRVVALAFQGLSGADNIGYGIPAPVVDHFLRDIDDGTYHGYPELGAATLETRNPALRADLGLTDQPGGVVVNYVDPYGSARDLLHDRDVLLSVNGCGIANDGTIRLDGTVVDFHELIERRQWGDAVEFTVWRSNAVATVQVPLRNPADPFMFRNLYDYRPPYIVVAGLVFCNLDSEHIRMLARQTEAEANQQVIYYSAYGKRDNLVKDREAWIVMVRRLPHPVNTYSEAYEYGILETVNGQTIRRLSDLRQALDKPSRGYHVLVFADMDEPLILNAEDVAAAAADIRRTYQIDELLYLGEETP